MTLTLQLPDAMAEKLTAIYPDEQERYRAVLNSIAETLEAEQQDRAEWTEIVNAELDALTKDEKTYSLDEARQHWETTRAELHRKAGQ